MSAAHDVEPGGDPPSKHGGALDKESWQTYFSFRRGDEHRCRSIAHPNATYLLVEGRGNKIKTPSTPRPTCFALQTSCLEGESRPRLPDHDHEHTGPTEPSGAKTSATQRATVNQERFYSNMCEWKPQTGSSRFRSISSAAGLI